MAVRRKGDVSERVQPTLLGHASAQGKLGGAKAPLADRMRPQTLADVVGQEHLLGPSGVLAQAINNDRLSSMILWGDPGCGKTTLAHVISGATKLAFEPFSAVLGGVAQLRELVKQAEERKRYQGRGTVLFVDEIHRFNRAQQDAFLPHVERGTVTLIGATTENPSFAVNSAVLSRTRVFRLKPLEEQHLVSLLERALMDPSRGIVGISADSASIHAIAQAARGDARQAFNQLESVADFAQLSEPDKAHIDLELLKRFHSEPTLLYDKAGEEHYNVVSALIKSMRGSDPDAAVYWLMRMLEAGDDPLFVLRRLMIFASEDVGNADPRALQVTVSADAAYRRMGMPEGLYPIAHACLYLASCPKSNSVGEAFMAAQRAVRELGALPVPNKLRNAVTEHMADEGYGKGYQYPHNHDDHFVVAETYLPQELEGTRFYRPSQQGLEQSIADRLLRLRTAKK